MSQTNNKFGNQPSQSTIVSDLTNLLNAKQHGDEWYAKCPCHEDDKPSLHIKRGDVWPVVVDCKRGCSWKDIFSYLETKLGYSLKPESNVKTFPGSDIQATYKYSYDKYQFEKVKYPNKKQAFRYLENGEWVWKKPKCPIFLYQHELLERYPNATVIICEGEKDCDNVNRLLNPNYVAVTNWNGANGWKADHSAFLVSRQVIIAEDNDTPGEERTKKIMALRGYKELLGVLKFTDAEVGPKGDVSDWLSRGATKDDLIQRLTTQLVSLDPESAPSCSDTGNAQRLIKSYGEFLRYSYELETWLCWNGRYWKKSKALPVEYAKKVCRDILKEAASLSSDGYKELAGHALASENSSRISAMLKLAQSIKGVAVEIEDLDKHPYLLNVQNGTIDLESGQLCAHNPKHLITKIIDLEYNEADDWTQASHWLNFLLEIFQGDKELIDYIQRAAGYSLTADITERTIFFLWGDGRNGKSTFVNALTHMLGSDYSKRVPISSLLKKKNEGVPNDIAALKGARWAYSSEAPEGKHLDEAFVKDASGGEKITARFMRSEWFEFIPEFKLWLSTNHKPEIEGADQAIWDRIALIPFKFRVNDGEIDPHLGEKLRKEAKFILKWAVLGCISWQKIKLSPPEVVKEATKAYKKEMNIVKDFIDQGCIKGKLCTAKVNEVYEAFKNFSGNSSITRNKFNKLVIAEGFEPPLIGSGNYSFWHGFELNSK